MHLSWRSNCTDATVVPKLSQNRCSFSPNNSRIIKIKFLIQVAYSMIAEEDFTNKTVVGANDMIKWPNIYAVSHMTVPIMPCYVIILNLRKRIVDFLENHNEALSREKKTMHSQLLQVTSLLSHSTKE